MRFENEVSCCGGGGVGADQKPTLCMRVSRELQDFASTYTGEDDKEAVHLHGLDESQFLRRGQMQEKSKQK